MTLSINASAGNNDCENESPGLASPKRKSDQISPSCRLAQQRSPLSDVNSSTAAASASSTPYKPPTPSRAALPPSYGSHSHGIHRFNPAKFKPVQPSRESIVATNETQASVNQLAGWLASESAKKKKTKPPIIHHASPKISFHAKPRIAKSDVEATDSKRVSVKALSSWMSNDPFEQKKVRTVRTGHRVIAKSRAFEKDEKLAAKIDVKAGSVGERSSWLNGAFKHGEEEGPKPPQQLREKKLRPYQMKKKEESPQKEELKSVRDKKEWLQKAFKKGGEGQEEDDQGSVEMQQSGIQQTRSFEAHPGTPSIQQAKSFETRSRVTIATSTPSIVKSVSIDARDSHPTIHQTKSCDGTSGVPPTVVERQRSVVRLYKNDEKESDEEESPRNTLKSVHDKQAWLSSAFKKKQSSATASKKVEDTVEKKHHNDTVSSPTVERAPEKKTVNAFKMVPALAAESVGTKQVVVVDLSARVNANNNFTPPPAEESKDGGSRSADGAKEMSVAERARWLRGAFK